MTYCVGLRVSEGLVLLADSLTNAGMDNVSRFTKMFTFEKPGERVLALLTSGKDAQQIARHHLVKAIRPNRQGRNR